MLGEFPGYTTQIDLSLISHLQSTYLYQELQGAENTTGNGVGKIPTLCCSCSTGGDKQPTSGYTKLNVC